MKGNHEGKLLFMELSNIVKQEDFENSNQQQVMFCPSLYEIPYSEFRVEIEIFDLDNLIKVNEKKTFLVNLSKINFTKQTQV